MAANLSQFEQALSIVSALSPLDKVHLVEKIMASLEDDLTQNLAKQNLAGLWANLQISAQDIDDARQEMWTNFADRDY